jgi:hypothetical protein
MFKYFILTSILILTGKGVWADTAPDLLIQCDAGSWEGHRTGFRRMGSEPNLDPSNSIMYPSITLILENSAMPGETAFVRYGDGMFQPAKSTMGTILYRSTTTQEVDYIVVAIKPQQILETLTIKLDSGEAILTNTIGDYSGISLDAFKSVCSVSTFTLSNAQDETADLTEINKTGKKILKGRSEQNPKYSPIQDPVLSYKLKP